MSYLDGIRGFINTQVSKFDGSKKAEKAQVAQDANPAKGAQNADTEFTVDMSELEVKAKMNKALGFVKQKSTAETNYTAIDKEFAKDPFTFAEKYASSEVRESAITASVDFDANATVLRTLSPERQNQVIAGFSQRNESPRAFTGEFLDLFTSVA